MNSNEQKKWLNSKVARSHNYKRHLTQQVYTSTIKVRYSIHIYNESSGHQATITAHYNSRHHCMNLFIYVTFYLCMCTVIHRNTFKIYIGTVCGVYLRKGYILTCNFNHIHGNIIKTKFIYITIVLFFD